MMNRPARRLPLPALAAGLAAALLHLLALGLPWQQQAAAPPLLPQPGPDEDKAAQLGVAMLARQLVLPSQAEAAAAGPPPADDGVAAPPPSASPAAGEAAPPDDPAAAEGQTAAPSPQAWASYIPRPQLSQGPQPLHSPMLEWPAGFGGERSRYEAVLALYIDEQGVVQRVEIEEGDDLPPPLAEAARATFAGLTYAPGRMDGAAVRSRLRIALSFEQSEPEPPADRGLRP